MFTSKNGEGGGPKSKFIDSKPENIDMLLSAFGISKTAIEQKSPEELMEKLEYIKNSMNNYQSLHDAGELPFDIDKLINTGKPGSIIVFLVVVLSPLPAIYVRRPGVEDTLIQNASGGVDTLPSAKPVKRNLIL